MAWAILVAAGLFETAFAVLLKLSHELTRPWPTAGFAAAAMIGVGLLTVALRELEVGTAYAVWTGDRRRGGDRGHGLARRRRLGRAAGVDRPDLDRGRRPLPAGRYPVTGWRARPLSAGMSGALDT